jgi:hypothetical protein
MRNSSVKVQATRPNNNNNSNMAPLDVADIAAMRKAAMNINKASQLENDLKLLIKDQ